MEEGRGVAGSQSFLKDDSWGEPANMCDKFPSSRCRERSRENGQDIGSRKHKTLEIDRHKLLFFWVFGAFVIDKHETIFETQGPSNFTTHSNQQGDKNNIMVAGR